MTDKYVYVVTFTRYEDDYKHRYDSGVYPEEMRVFKNAEKAYNDHHNILLELYEEYMKGEYVDYKFDWDINKVKIE